MWYKLNIQEEMERGLKLLNDHPHYDITVLDMCTIYEKGDNNNDFMLPITIAFCIGFSRGFNSGIRHNKLKKRVKK